MKKIHLKYKQDTGNPPPMKIKIPIWRRKGEWLIDITDARATEMGCVIDTSEMTEYTQWLEDLVEKLQEDIDFLNLTSNVATQDPYLINN